jgi:hypothetical protein
VARRGYLIVGIDPTYPPNEYKNSEGTIVGFDVELFNAVAAKLGPKTRNVASVFDNIVPGITAPTPKYNIGVASFTDHASRCAAAGDASDHPADRQRSDQHAEDHLVGRSHPLDQRPLRRRQQHRRLALPAYPVAAGGIDVVPGHHQCVHGRAVLPGEAVRARQFAVLTNRQLIALAAGQGGGPVVLDGPGQP